MSMRQRNSLFFAAVLAAAMLPGARALAHISLEEGGTHMSRYGDDEIKDGPCGRTNGQRGTNVYTYKPGETIKVTINEFIPHPGYFRIAFDNDGDDGFEVPATTDGEFGNCAGDPKCGPGMTDYCNNDTVLLDYLDPHASAGLGNTPEYTWSVTLPNVECTNCTLQIIQVMNDLNVHFAPYPADDIYYQCIDLVLSNTAQDVTDAPVANDGMDCTAGGPQGGAGGAGSGGASGGGAGGGGMAGAAGAGAGGAGAGGGSGMGSGGTMGGAGMAGSAGAGAGGGAAAGRGGSSGTPALGTAGATAGAGGGVLVPMSGATSSDSGGCSVARPVGAPRYALAVALLLVGAALSYRRTRTR